MAIIFLQYDSVNKKSECRCKPQTETSITDAKKLSFENMKIVETFYKILKTEFNIIILLNNYLKNEFYNNIIPNNIYNKYYY